MEGFSKIVEDAWKESPSDESNAMIRMMEKLKFLKTKIREWNKTNMLCRKNVKAQCKADLEAMEVTIDSGNGNEEIVIKRMELVKNLQHIDKLNSLEIAQKAKVKWPIEGDENSGFFHDASLWVRVIKAIYGEAGNMDAKMKAGSTSCWMSIVHEAKSLVSKGIDFFKFMRFKLGNGENARFWEDRWIEGDTFKKCFPRVYALELCKEIIVAMKVTQPCLAFSFRRSPRGGVEQEQFKELVTRVHDVRLVPMSDR
nr:RNA-directed DNA polymerase, eukaryota, reverse transcriptase zinc-binding domain protein [Tanacetum cinerariifolium]